MNEIYIELALDSFLAALIFPFHGEFILRAVLAFDEYNKNLLFTIAFCASILGHITNYVIGGLLNKLVEKEPWFHGKIKERYSKISSFLSGYPVCMLIFSGVSIAGSFLTLFAGFFRIRFYLVLIMIVLAKIIYYALI